MIDSSLESRNRPAVFANGTELEATVPDSFTQMVAMIIYDRQQAQLTGNQPLRDACKRCWKQQQPLTPPHKWLPWQQPQAIQSPHSAYKRYWMQQNHCHRLLASKKGAGNQEIRLNPCAVQYATVLKLNHTNALPSQPCAATLPK